MHELTVFENEAFGDVRVLDRDGEPWFVAKDVCSCLELGNVGQALSYLDDDEKSSIDPNIITADVGFDAMMKDAHTPMRSVIPEAGRGGRPLSLVSEPGLYSLILRSRKPEAKAFKRWVTHDVIPSIRKRGLYATPHTVEAMLADPDTAIKLLTSLKEERAKSAALAAKVEQDAPKVLFADSVAASKTSILIGDMAKILAQNGIKIGQKRLFAYLREHGYLMQAGRSKNIPTQHSIEKGLFEVKESAVTMPDGSVRTRITPMVTGKGQLYFVKKFLSSTTPAAA